MLFFNVHWVPSGRCQVHLREGSPCTFETAQCTFAKLHRAASKPTGAHSLWCTVHLREGTLCIFEGKQFAFDGAQCTFEKVPRSDATMFCLGQQNIDVNHLCEGVQCDFEGALCNFEGGLCAFEGAMCTFAKVHCVPS